MKPIVACYVSYYVSIHYRYKNICYMPQLNVTTIACIKASGIHNRVPELSSMWAWAFE